MRLRDDVLAAVLCGLSLLVGTPALAVQARKAAAEVVQPDEDTVVIPADLEPKLQGLSRDERDFISSGKTDRFLPRQVLFDRFRNRTPQEIEAMIDAMMSAVAQLKYRPGVDADSIPLDTETPNYNGWKLKRPPNLDPKREPGPINLNRYVSARYRGIPTFAGAAVALTPEDLRAGRVDIAIAGVPLDMGSGFRGARFGPLALRTAGIGPLAPFGNDMSTMIDPMDVLNVVDYGDIAIDFLSTERSIEYVRSEVKAIAETGAIPFIVGGDHSLEYPDVAAITDIYGKGNVGVVHLDAHYDAGNAGKNFDAHLLSHGTPVYRLIKEGYVPGKNYIQVGLRGSDPDPAAAHWMREQGFHYHTMAEVEQKGWEAVINRAVKEARQDAKYLYVSIDVDVVDPTFIPGTGTPAAGGMYMREVLPLMRRLCAETNLVGFEIVEIDPLLDPSYKTAQNSNYIMFACMTGVAMHRKGITQEHFLSPLATDHGQPER